MFLTTLFVSFVILVIVNGQRLPPSHLASPANKYGSTARTATDGNLTFVISARDLPSADIIGQVDPFVKLYSSSKEKPEFEKFGTSDVVTDSPNPEFNQVFWFVWKKGTEQKWKIILRDQDNLRPDNPLGEVVVDVDNYVANRQNLNVTLDTNGTLLIQKTTPLKFKLHARNLPSLDTVGKSDPFVKIYWRRGSKGTDIPLFTTAVKENAENPDWEETIEFANYIKDTDQWWSFEVFDHDGLSSNDELGEALVEVDNYAGKNEPKIVKIGKDGKAQLGITPVKST